MKRFQILGVAVLALAMWAPDAMAQRRGGAVSGGMRGAMVGGMVGGGSGAKTGAKVGAVAGATRGAVQRADYREDQRNAINQEASSREQYVSTAEYQNSAHSDFNQSPPEVMVTSATVESSDKSKETVINQNGKPILAITYPADWKLKKGDHAITATSPDGHLWSAISTLERAKDKEAGIAKIKGELSKYLQDIQFDEPTKTKRGALILTGTGKGKKSGAEVVFATGVFDAAPQQLAGAAFIVDKNLEDHYKETVRSICQTIRCESDSSSN
jgi:uncharacterized protein YcfJ